LQTEVHCIIFFSPVPTVSWSGPSNALPVGRYRLLSFNTELTISNITAADEGDYICTASNTQGRIAHTLQMRVEGLYYETCLSGFYFGFLSTCLYPLLDVVISHCTDACVIVTFIGSILTYRICLKRQMMIDKKRWLNGIL